MYAKPFAAASVFWPFPDHVRRLLPDCECINLGDQSAESVRGSVRLADCSWGGRFDLRLFDFENAFG